MPVAAVLAAIICVGAPQIRAEGRRPAADRAAEWQIVKMRVTAYCPCSKCCGQHSDGITACGHEICTGDRFVAADRRYSFGTEMIVPGYNGTEVVQVLDRGGAIRGERLDVFFNTHQEALNWGVQYLYVKVRGGSQG
jgi:3D (Asp-Asp-Asp) domain-containing protein